MVFILFLATLDLIIGELGPATTPWYFLLISFALSIVGAFKSNTLFELVYRRVLVERRTGYAVPVTLAVILLALNLTILAMSLNGIIPIDHPLILIFGASTAFIPKRIMTDLDLA